MVFTSAQLERLVNLSKVTETKGMFMSHNPSKSTINYFRAVRGVKGAVRGSLLMEMSKGSQRENTKQTPGPVAANTLLGASDSCATITFFFFGSAVLYRSAAVVFFLLSACQLTVYLRVGSPVVCLWVVSAGTEERRVAGWEGEWVGRSR